MKQRFDTLFNKPASELFKKAQELSRDVPTIFTTPIAFTTLCNTKPPCHHCFWRSQSYTNKYFARKAQPDETIAAAKIVAESGIHRILIPSGCIGHDLPRTYYEHVSRIKDVACKINPDIELFAISGHLSKDSLLNLKAAGLDGYCCSLEIPNEKLFKKIRPGDDFHARIQTIRDIKEVGLKVWSGFLYGLGEKKEDIIYAMNFLSQYELDSISIKPYQQYPYIEMEKRSAANLYSWAKLVAISRIRFGKINVYTKPEYANWGFMGGANAMVPIMIMNQAVTNTDLLLQMREATNRLITSTSA